MRFLSLLLLPACSLVDAAGDATGSSGGLDFDRLNVPGGGPSPRQAIFTDLDGVNNIDAVILNDTGGIQRVSFSADGRAPLLGNPAFGPYTVIAVGNVDDDSVNEVVGVGMNPPTLHVLKPNVSLEGFVMTDLSAQLDPADNTDSPVAATVGSFAAGRAIVIGYQSDSNLRVVLSPLAGPTAMGVNFETQPPPFRTVLGVGNVKSDDPVDELVATSGGLLQELSGASFSRREIPFGASLPRFAFGQFNGDNILDVAASSLGSDGPNELDIFVGGQTGLVADPGGFPPFGIGTVADDLGVADIDGDGADDVAVLTTEDGERRFKVFFGGDAFGSRESSFTVDNRNAHMAFGDINNDGKADVLLVPGAGGGVDYLLSR